MEMFLFKSRDHYQRLMILAQNEQEAKARLDLLIANNPRLGADWVLLQAVSETVENAWFVNPW